RLPVRPAGDEASNGRERDAGRVLACVAAAWLCLAVSPPTQALEDGGSDKTVEALDVVFDDAFTRYAPPGLAVGVIVDGEVRYARTRGELVAGGGQGIDGATLCKIASNSKAMTTALLARLVDEGKLEWTDPVAKHLPDFRMH